MLRSGHGPYLSLTTKIVVSVCGFVLLGGMLFWNQLLRSEEESLTREITEDAQTISSLIESSLRQAMLQAHPQAIQRTLESIDRKDSILALRVLHLDGRIYSSSRTGERNKMLQEVADRQGLAELEAPLATAPSNEQVRIFQHPGGYRMLSVVTPIANSPDCSSAFCHVHPPDRENLGLLMTDLSLSQIDGRIKNKMVTAAFSLFTYVIIMATALTFILWRLIIRPLHTLSIGMKRVSAGDLATTITIERNDELGDLARTFNDMREEIAQHRGKLREWNERLEAEVARKTEEIKKTHHQLLQAEKLGALGRLTAEVAHQIRNPLTALGGFGRRLYRSATDDTQQKYAYIIMREAERLENILKDVLIFSKESKRVFEKRPVTALVNDAILLYRETCDEQQVAIELAFGTDSTVLIEEDQLRQALNNLIANALDAMPEGGTMSVQTGLQTMNHVCYLFISVLDTGPGIEEDMICHLFEPFFTTKKSGKGTGLGLAISKKIVEEHQGLIHVANRPEGGLAATLFIPCADEGVEGSSPCWEHKNCERPTNDEQSCPSFPHFGSSCWAVAGSLCSGPVRGTFAKKIESCQECDFFKMRTGSSPPKDSSA